MEFVTLIDDEQVSSDRLSADMPKLQISFSKYDLGSLSCFRFAC